MTKELVMEKDVYQEMRRQIGIEGRNHSLTIGILEACQDLRVLPEDLGLYAEDDRSKAAFRAMVQGLLFVRGWRIGHAGLWTQLEGFPGEATVGALIRYLGFRGLRLLQQNEHFRLYHDPSWSWGDRGEVRALTHDNGKFQNLLFAWNGREIWEPRSNASESPKVITRATKLHDLYHYSAPILLMDCNDSEDQG